MVDSVRQEEDPLCSCLPHPRQNVLFLNIGNRWHQSLPGEPLGQLLASSALPLRWKASVTAIILPQEARTCKGHTAQWTVTINRKQGSGFSIYHLLDQHPAGARSDLVLALQVCYQTQLITAVLPCLPISCCPIRSGGGGRERNEEAGTRSWVRPLLAVSDHSGGIPKGARATGLSAIPQALAEIPPLTNLHQLTNCCPVRAAGKSCTRTRPRPNHSLPWLDALGRQGPT